MRKLARYKLTLIAIFGGLLSLGLVTGPGAADPVILHSGDQIPGTVWEVIFPNSVMLIFNEADKTNDSAGTLIALTARTNNASITLQFQQIFETPTSLVAGGLRLNYQSTVTNVTGGPAWAGYQLQLIDDFPAPNEPKSNIHPSQPHFHPNPRIVGTAAKATFIFGETFTGNENKYISSFLGKVPERGGQADPADLILLGGNVGQGRSVQILNLLIHERQFAIGVIPDPGRRIFRLVETPIP
jgi:hypothetical protein